MNKYEQHIDWLVSELENMFAMQDAIRTIKDNPEKYPEFDFWVPGYDAEGWAEKAIETYSKLMGDSFKNEPIVFKLIVVRHYRKLAQKWRKAGKGDLLESEEFAVEVVNIVKKHHPEYFV